MLEMSPWARELATEVKAAAPKAPEPVYASGEGNGSSGLSWVRAGRVLACAMVVRGGATYYLARRYPDWSYHWGESEPCEFRREERKRLGLSPRAYFVRLVKEMWS